MTRRTLMTVPAVVAALALGACGSSEDKSAGSGTTAAARSGYMATVDREVDALYEGAFAEPKQASPAARGKRLFVISCGQQVPSCSIPAASAVEAGRELGWDVTVIDGRFSPPAFASAVDTAVAGKADGIMLVAVDCQFVRPQLLAAKQAGIKIGAAYAIDCDDPSVGKPALFDAPMIAGGDRNWARQVSRYEADRMKVAIARTNGKAKVIDFDQDSLLITRIIRRAAEEELKKCAGCELLESVPIALGDTPNVIQQKTQTALSRHPDANVLFPLHDGMTLSGVAAGLRASGRSDDVFLVGADGFPPSMDLVRSGVQDAQVAFPADWTAYATVDGLNRVFGGKQPQESGIGWQLVDESRNLASSGGYTPPVDFRAAYLRLWGVG